MTTIEEWFSNWVGKKISKDTASYLGSVLTGYSYSYLSRRETSKDTFENLDTIRILFTALFGNRANLLLIFLADLHEKGIDVDTGDVKNDFEPDIKSRLGMALDSHQIGYILNRSPYSIRANKTISSPGSLVRIRALIACRAIFSSPVESRLELYLNWLKGEPDKDFLKGLHNLAEGLQKPLEDSNMGFDKIVALETLLSLPLTGISQAQLGKVFGVSNSHVSKINKRLKAK